MKLAVPRESHRQETRVALSPETAKKFRALGLDVDVERGAGTRAGFPDAEYEAAGARAVDGVAALLSGADLVLKVRAPTAGEFAAMRPGTALYARNLYNIVSPFVDRETGAVAFDTLSAPESGEDAYTIGLSYQHRF